MSPQHHFSVLLVFLFIIRFPLDNQSPTAAGCVLHNDIARPSTDFEGRLIWFRTYADDF